MYSYEERRVAVELWCQFGGRVAATVRGLAYPSIKQLRRWNRYFLEHNEIPKLGAAVASLDRGATLKGRYSLFLE